ncbi:MAG: 6-carboxytetrahydropterin synthase [Pseudomonadota bacterium]
MSANIFQSTKVFEGFSIVFRQWHAQDTHCRYIHGYGVSFKIWFSGELDEKNWVWDFGKFTQVQTEIDGMTPKQWVSYMFDHTFIAAEDDPHLPLFQDMAAKDLIQLRIVKAVGAERFAQLIYDKFNAFILRETNGRVRVSKVEFSENRRNSAIYQPDLTI